MPEQALIATNYYFNDKQRGFTRGKVRDVYNIDDQWVVLIACDRISAFDMVLPKPIPYKGQVLNQIASHFLDLTAEVVPNWKIASPDPNATIGLNCKPYPVEMIVRGYLAGHAWREYNSGKRSICGVRLPDGLNENDPLPKPIITPTIKATSGHDEDISKKQIIKRNLVSEEDYEQLEAYSYKLYQLGSDYAKSRGLILADTKYEFGNKDGVIHLIDEVHTPDSSRYFYADGFEERQNKGEKQKQLSKEFVRQWLIENGFQGREDEKLPELTEPFIESVTNRYIELYNQLVGSEFEKSDYSDILNRIEFNVKNFLDAQNGQQA